MALQIEWTPDAELHLTEILEYWIARNGSDFFSKQLYQAVKKILEVLSRYPESGRITSNFSSCSASRCSRTFIISFHSRFYTSFWTVQNEAFQNILLN